MLRQDKSDRIRRIFETWRVEDRAVFEGLLADDFTFTSPYDDAIDKATYFERCWPNSGRISSIAVEEIFDRGDEAFVRYRAVTKEGKEFRNVEFLRFAGERLREINVYFGASYQDGAFVRR